MRRYGRLTWIVLGGILCFAMYFVSYHPLRAAQDRVPALRHPIVTQTLEPARWVAESESLSGPMQRWARMWGQRTRCQPSLKNLGLALHNDWDVYGPSPTSGADVSVDSRPGHPPDRLSMMSGNDMWAAPGPVLSTCDGCGACCLEQGAPPDYVALRLNPHFAGDPTFAEDAARLAALPDEAQRLLDEYLLARESPEIATSGACVWYDAGTFRCRYYEHRPSTCRIFERDSPGCHIYRRRHGIGDVPGD